MSNNDINVFSVSISVNIIIPVQLYVIRIRVDFARCVNKPSCLLLCSAGSAVTHPPVTLTRGPLKVEVSEVAQPQSQPTRPTATGSYAKEEGRILGPLQRPRAQPKLKTSEGQNARDDLQIYT